MRFTPKTENQIAEENNLKPGIYDFEVVHTDDKPSKAGNDMITLKLHVFDEDGDARIVFDYLLEAMAYKLRHAADACGLIDKYDTGHLDHNDFMGKTGKLKIAIKKGQNGHPDQAGVADYVKRDNAEIYNQAAATLPVTTALNDEIPF